MTKNRWH